MRLFDQVGISHRSVLVIAALALTLADTDALRQNERAGAQTIEVTDESQFDPSDGRDPAHYPPDRIVDVTHIKLELTFRNLTSKSFSGVETYEFRAIAPGVRRLVLDAVDLTIADVTDANGTNLEHDHDGEHLTVRFPAALPTDSDSSIVIRYTCSDPVDGLVFVAPDDAHPDRSPQIHSLGQPEFNRFWFPCHDFPNDRSTTEMIVTVPAGFSVLSNGRLIERTENGNTVTWHWRQDLPHVVYLVSLVIGEFSVIEEAWRGIPVTYWVRRGDEENAARTFARTGDMLTFFSKRFGYDYPYAQYAQVVVTEFGIGGMEHTSATTLYDHVILDQRAALDHDQDGLISHELAHQWFGDLITCRSWEHIWLNEGFATFCNDLWYEHWKGNDLHLYQKWLKYRAVAAADSTESPDAVLWDRYDDPVQVFRHKNGLPYGKGSSILHMLRHEIGDQRFFAAIGRYVRAYASKTVETDDLRRILQAATGRNLEQFFRQWADRPDVPRFDIHYTWHDTDNVAEVTIRQTQPIDREHPAFDVPLDLYFRAAGREHPVKKRIRRAKEVVRMHFEARPDIFCVDPQAGLLKQLTCTKPRTMWMTQLTDGPTIATRCEAAAGLARYDRPEVARLLQDVASSKDEFWGVRAQAALALGTVQTDGGKDALLELLVAEGPLENPKVRRAAVEALGQYRHPGVTETLVRFATADPSYAVEASATRAIGSARRAEAIDTVIAGTEKDSFQDQIRRAAVWALGELADQRGVAACIRVASAGHHHRTRPEAIDALAKLARRGRHGDQIESLILNLLNDRERRTRVAAVAALVTMRSVNAVEPLSTIAANGRRKAFRDAAREAIDDIIAHLDTSEATTLLRQELQMLHDRRKTLEDRAKTLADSLDIADENGEDQGEASDR